MPLPDFAIANVDLHVCLCLFKGERSMSYPESLRCHQIWRVSWPAIQVKKLCVITLEKLVPLQDVDRSYICSFVSFKLHSFCGKLKGGDNLNRFNYTSWVTVVLFDRLKSVHNNCVIEVFGGGFALLLCFLEFSVSVRSFVIFVIALFLFEVTQQTRKNQIYYKTISQHYHHAWCTTLTVTTPYHNSHLDGWTLSRSSSVKAIGI